MAAWVAVVLVGEPALGVLGDTYAADSAQLLVLLVPAGYWMVVKDHLVVVWRRERRYTLATTVAATSLLPRQWVPRWARQWTGLPAWCWDGSS